MAQHISLRVPWHDNSWNGNTCLFPKENQSCLRLRNIYENKNDVLEEENHDCNLCRLECIDKIPCIREGGAIMSKEQISITVEHPYVKFGYKTHGHLLPTTEIIPPYSYPARPFRWTMKTRRLRGNNVIRIEELAREKGIDYHPEYEPEMKANTWVQDGRNQRAIFNNFFQDVVPGESLCLFYAKQVPFIEDNRRVIIGIGHVKAINPSVDYKSSDPNGMLSCTWETMVLHTIRDDMKDGFLFPYKELMEYAETDENFDIRTTTVFAADDFFDEFSYATEQVSYDAVIDVILQSIKAMNVIKKTGIKGEWDKCINWLNAELISVWEDRGAFPGLGAVLVAFGVKSGVVVARELKAQTGDSKDLWQLVDKMFDNPRNILSDFCAEQITPTLSMAWKGLTKQRKALFQILARVTLSLRQANVLYNKEERKANEINVTDEELLANPYLLYEKTRDKIAELQISIKKVDLAFFPPAFVKNQYHIDAPTKIESENDMRRVRAIAVSVLELNANMGNTVMPMSNLILQINSLPIEPACPVNGDIVSAMKDFFTDEIVFGKDGFDQDYFKLIRYKKIDDIIQTQVKKRISSPNRHNIPIDWRKRIDDEFGICNETDINEINARNEKAEALKTLAESRLSVLVGGAGTGKTTVLKLLCQEKSIQDGGIYLLAPTGKARVRMSQGLRGKVTFKAFTVAQFLSKTGRYDGETFTYKILERSSKSKDKNLAIPETVIIDESSMLTEEMFGALLDAVKTAGRIIFVGDTNQLPPIGAGRPFVDLVRYVESMDFDNQTARKCCAKLYTTRRQKQEENLKDLRADIRLSKWYTETSEQLDEDIFAEIQSGVADGTIVFKKWHEKEDLEQAILEAVSDAAGMSSTEDKDGFNCSLGALVLASTQYGWQTFFNRTSQGKQGCAESVENWQILSPVRNNAQGVLNINHMIHEKYRKDFLELSERDRDSDPKIPNKMGPEGIVYGDKVINLINTSKKIAFPTVDTDENYVANGEIGMACSNFGVSGKALQYLNVEFSSQIGHTYSYTKGEFGEEVTAPLELAYALTVHKSQGSQFKSVILVLSDKCFLLSKELLYTALTRQEDRLYILYNEDAYNLRKYSSMEFSDIARRYTDLFAPPKIVKVNNHYYEDGLIHRAKDGRMFRSKSEVIIANMLIDNGYDDFLYEEKLPIGDTYKLPDFTFKDAATGSIIIWEHCGMMSNPEYRERWETKKKLYEINGFSEERGNLIVTYDDKNGGIDSAVIQEKIDSYLIGL